MAHQLKYNIAEFSAFKETSFKAQVEAALVNNGRIRSWSEFKAAAKELGIQYNQRWLKTEYNQTVAQAQSVEKWKQIEADQDLYPNLEYKTIGDKRVRDEHKDWNGLIRPVNDPFWQTHLPPNDWGCRCYVKQTIEDVNRPNESFTPPKEDFANNPAMTGKLYKENAYEKGLSKADKAEAEKLAKENLLKANLKQQRLEIRDWAKANLLDKTITHPKINEPIGFNVAGIKEAINQPHKFLLAKNEAVKNIEKHINESEFMFSRNDDKGKPFVYYYLKTFIQGEQSFIVIRRAYDKNTFYSIVEKIRE